MKERRQRSFPKATNSEARVEIPHTKPSARSCRQSARRRGRLIVQRTTARRFGSRVRIDVRERTTDRRRAENSTLRRSARKRRCKSRPGGFWIRSFVRRSRATAPTTGKREEKAKWRRREENSKGEANSRPQSKRRISRVHRLELCSARLSLVQPDRRILRPRLLMKLPARVKFAALELD